MHRLWQMHTARECTKNVTSCDMFECVFCAPAHNKLVQLRLLRDEGHSDSLIFGQIQRRHYMAVREGGQSRTHSIGIERAAHNGMARTCRTGMNASKQNSKIVFVAYPILISTSKIGKSYEFFQVPTSDSFSCASSSPPLLHSPDVCSRVHNVHKYLFRMQPKMKRNPDEMMVVCMASGIIPDTTHSHREYSE